MRALVDRDGSKDIFTSDTATSEYPLILISIQYFLFPLQRVVAEAVVSVFIDCQAKFSFSIRA